MADTVRSALLISAMGMGLVFGVILLLWGLIALLVRLGADRPADGTGGAGDDGDTRARTSPDRAARAAAASATASVLASEEGLGASGAKARAAAAAVGAYLASERRAH